MNKTNVLTEGAMLSALYLIVLLLTIYVPFLAMLIIWFLPLPFILYATRHGLKSGIILLFIALLITVIIGGPVLLPLTLLFGSGGVVIGELYRRKKTAFAVLLGGSLTFIANIILSFVFSIVVLGIHPIESMQELMQQSIDTAAIMLGEESADQLALFRQFVDELDTLAPFIIIFTGVAYAIIIQLIAAIVLKRLRMSIASFPPFREWKFPKSFLWYYLIVLIVILMGVEQGTTLYIISMNLFRILEIIMVIQGLAFVFYFSYVKELSRAIPVIILIIVLIFPAGLHLVRILGIIDLGFDLRSRLKK